MVFKENKTYLRDGRSPIPANENISRSMRGNKAKDTKPEMTLRKSLWNAGIRGYRVNLKTLPGRPDIFFPRKGIAIFIHGCFWHRCNKCKPNFPKSNIEFWQTKFEKNIARDKQKSLTLEALGFKVMTIWECEIKKDPSNILDTLRKELVHGEQ